MEDKDDIRLRNSALKFTYQTPTLIRKLTKSRIVLRYYIVFYLRLLRSVTLYSPRLFIIMAEFIKTDISSADAAFAIYDSVITLLRRLESTKRENKSLEYLSDQIFCVANILETFTATFDKSSTCKRNCYKDLLKEECPTVKSNRKLRIW